ncbi:hypothetical protein LCGC14_1165070 [marine sediment metagenome]|uniref:N4-gp56 family major capsid protein n=1 Tax=marine sediment metagenome TaxID=412755 RepID=A0A0F9LRK2_9ZZZZ
MPLLTTTSDIPVNIQGYYDRNILDNAVPYLIHDRFGQTRPVPKNKGDQITFRRMGALEAATTKLVEGITPTGKKLSSTEIVAYLAEYGDYVTLTKWFNMTNLDGNLLGAGEVQGNQAGDTADLVIRTGIISGTSVRRAAGVASRGAIATAFSDADVAAIVRTLEGNNAKFIHKAIYGGVKVNTYPIRKCFPCITHTDNRYDIERLTGFKSVEEYASQKNVMEEEIGTVGNLRFLTTTNAKIWPSVGIAVGSTGLKAIDSTNIDVYSTLVLAKDAYGITPLGKRNISHIIKKFGSGDDPLNQRGTSGWIFALVSKILNDDFIIRAEHGVTDL